MNRNKKSAFDWILFSITLTLLLIGALTIYSPVSVDNLLFVKQLVFIIIFIITIFALSKLDLSFLRSPVIAILLYVFSIVGLIGLLLFAPEINGAKSWIIFGGISVQLVDFIKIALIISLAQYFTHRHIYINQINHFFISLTLALIPFVLVLLQSDLGSAMVILGIWFGITIASGLNKKYIFSLMGLCIVLSALMWNFTIQPYQKERIKSFLNPTGSIQTSGYSAYQAKVAVGSGGLFGKGIGEGTQSEFKFLPLYEADFILSAYSEEWGFVGVVFILLLYLLLLYYLFSLVGKMRTNFESLFIVGVSSNIFSHFLIHSGVNFGLLPVTGITLTFMSYGGSHVLASAILIGIVMSFQAKN